jgi:hypothetical protein
MGPMSGRGAGHCALSAFPGYAGRTRPAEGFGCGCGFRRGHRNRFFAAGTPGWGRFGYPGYMGAGQTAPDQETLLKNQAEALENQLRLVNQRLNDLSEASRA